MEKRQPKGLTDAGDLLSLPDIGLNQAELNQRSLYGAIAGAGDETLATHNNLSASSQIFRFIKRL